jgi:hypothetical protein
VRFFLRVVEVLFRPLLKASGLRGGAAIDSTLGDDSIRKFIKERGDDRVYLGRGRRERKATGLAGIPANRA